MKHFALPLVLAACLSAPGAVSAQAGETINLTDAQMEELVRRSYQYVAMFNVNNKFAPDLEKYKSWTAPKAKKISSDSW